MDERFAAAFVAAYDFPDSESLVLGAPFQAGETATGTLIRQPLAMMNRHGLIAGATGTGKTRTLQMLAGQLSAAGVPVFLADMKGDLSGLTTPGAVTPKIDERCAAIGRPFQPAGCPVEFYSLTGKGGLPLRATVSSFGPLLLSRVLDLNETQSSALAMVLKFCDDQGLLL
ncbi:MAG TPA: helicase HerA-like domain-containing protein, partial [Candidatus Eisenbacteria bacterium]